VTQNRFYAYFEHNSFNIGTTGARNVWNKPVYKKWRTRCALGWLLQQLLWFSR